MPAFGASEQQDIFFDSDMFALSHSLVMCTARNERKREQSWGGRVPPISQCHHACVLLTLFPRTLHLSYRPIDSAEGGRPLSSGSDCPSTLSRQHWSSLKSLSNS